MDIDKRIADIMAKMKKLSSKNPIDTCGEFPPKWEKPFNEKTVQNFEVRNGIRLPEDYRRFITTIARSGTQPFYGLRSIDGRSDLTADIKANFPYTLKNPLNIDKLSDEEYNKLFSNSHTNSGFIELCTEGCAMYSILIVNAEDEDVYGTVWYYDLANDLGIFPLVNPKKGEPLRFLDWLEYYVDRTLELDDDDYFSYSELIDESSLKEDE